MSKGVQPVGSPQVGSLIGAVGGLAFVLANASGPLALAVRVLGLVAFAGVVVVILRARRRPDHGPGPSRSAWRTYLISVAAMLAAFPLGGLLVNRVLERPALMLPWVVFVVGAHFLPFARAFGASIFTVLGWTLIAAGVLGGLAVVLVDDRASAWTGVVAGFALLAFGGAGALRR